jgi:hypothetical protein
MQTTTLSLLEVTEVTLGADTADDATEGATEAALKEALDTDDGTGMADPLGVWILVLAAAAAARRSASVSLRLLERVTGMGASIALTILRFCVGVVTAVAPLTWCWTSSSLSDAADDTSPERVGVRVRLSEVRGPAPGRFGVDPMYVYGAWGRAGGRPIE